MESGSSEIRGSKLGWPKGRGLGYVLYGYIFSISYRIVPEVTNPLREAVMLAERTNPEGHPQGQNQGRIC